MSFPAYPQYKNTEIPWMQRIPSSWQLLPFFSRFFERKESNKGMKSENLLSLSYGRIVRKDITTLEGLLPASFETYQVVHPGDIVFRLTDLQNDKRSLRSAIVNEKGIITSAYLAVSAKDFNPSFSNYLFRAYDLMKVFYSMGGGLRQSMKYDDMKWLQIVCPSINEQTQIARFLDHETAKIDALIREQARLIKLLHEKRQAVISHAVTKGLDPYVPMKDSEVEWLGEVPAHWDVSRLKFATSLIIDCPHETPNYDPEGEFLVIRTADIHEGLLKPTSMYRLKKQDFVHRTRRAALRKLDIVYGREGERWGHAALVPENGMFCLGQRMMQFRVNDEFDAHFLMYQLNSTSVYRQGDLDTVGATSPHVNVSTIRNYDISCPPKGEQVVIGEYLEQVLSRYDELINESAKSSLTLKERRSALISAAVTGKIDVRDWQPPGDESAFDEEVRQAGREVTA